MADKENKMPMAQSSVLRAIEEGDVALLKRALQSGTSVNYLQGRDETAMCYAVDRDEVDHAVIAVLMQHGTAMFFRNKVRETVFDVAARRKHAGLIEVLADPENHGGPRWHREFLAGHAPRVTVMLRQADGFAVDPDDIERPFRIGGTYMGHGYEADRELGAMEFEQMLSLSREKLQWFAPYVQKIIDGDDFSIVKLVEEHGEQCHSLEYQPRPGDPEWVYTAPSRYMKG